MPLAVVESYHSERIRAQRGAFTIFPYYKDEKKMKRLRNVDIFLDAMENMGKMCIRDSVLSDTGKRFYLEPDEYCNELMLLREELREQLQKADIQICLEDIFTLFDKCITMKENTVDYTYPEIDNLQDVYKRQLLASSIENLRDKNGEKLYTPQQVYEWLDRIRVMGNYQVF